MSHFVLRLHESPYSFNSLINKPQQLFTAVLSYTIRSDARMYFPSKRAPSNGFQKTPLRLLSNASAFKVKRPCVLPKT